MVVTATPQSMASRDVPESSPSAIIAKVMDVKGNPVKNENVSFTIIHHLYPASQEIIPSFSGSASLNATNAVTDSSGNAIVYFYPGKFWDSSSDDFDEQATANCSVSATWTNTSLNISKTGTVDLEWKNYPWLSVKTSVEPKLVPVNGTINVTLQLIGDGWALNPKPIDVMLIIDRSGSMDTNDMAGGAEKDHCSKKCSKYICFPNEFEYR